MNAHDYLASIVRPNQPPSVADLPEWATKGEVAALVYPHIEYDTALPQDWVDRCIELGFDPRSCFVWGYPDGSIFGQPLPITAEGARDLPAEMI